MKYKCPECKEIFAAEEWNNATISYCGEDVGLIESEEKDDCYYYCPECEKEVMGDCIEEIK